MNLGGIKYATGGTRLCWREQKVIECCVEVTRLLILQQMGVLGSRVSGCILSVSY